MEDDSSLEERNHYSSYEDEENSAKYVLINTLLNVPQYRVQASGVSPGLLNTELRKLYSSNP